MYQAATDIRSSGAGLFLGAGSEKLLFYPQITLMTQIF